MLKAIFFDLGYTLLRNRRTELYSALLPRFGAPVPGDLVDTLTWADQYFMKHYPGLLGRPPEEWITRFVTLVLERAGITGVDPAAFGQALRANRPRRFWLPFPDAVPTLQDLRARGYRLGLISNWDGTGRTVVEENGLLPYLDPVVISAEVGVEKPDERIFRIALAAAGVTAEESLYVGDNYYDDVVGARRAGMRAVLLRRRAGLGEELDCDEIRSLSELPEYLERGGMEVA